MSREGAFHLVLDTYVVARGARLRIGLKVPSDRDLIVGLGAHVGGSVRGGTNVYLMRGSHVEGSIETNLDVVVGAEARVAKDIRTKGNVYVQSGAHVAGAIEAGGLVRIVGGFVAGPVRAMGDIEVGAESVLHEAHAGGRIRTLPLVAPVPDKDDSRAGVRHVT